MRIKCKCGEPMRFVGSMGMQMAGGFGSVVGVECPDPKCKRNKVLLAQQWIESLEWHPEEKAMGRK